MQRRHAQQNYLDCQEWAESPSRRLGSCPSRQTSEIIAPIPQSYVVCHYGGREGQGANWEWGEGQSLAITTMFCLEFAYVFRLFCLDKEGC